MGSFEGAPPERPGPCGGGHEPEPDPSSHGSGPAKRVAERGLATAGRLKASSAWTERDEAELEQRFEAAAVAALRVPALAERSARLRQVGRRFVPEPLRPALRAAARSLDRAAARVLERYDVARGARP